MDKNPKHPLKKKEKAGAKKHQKHTYEQHCIRKHLLMSVVHGRCFLLALGFACGDTVLTAAVLAIVLTAPLGAFAINFSYHKLLLHEDQKK